MSEHSDRGGSKSPSVVQDELDLGQTTEIQTIDENQEVGTSASGQNSVPDHQNIINSNAQSSSTNASGQTNNQVDSDQIVVVDLEEHNKLKLLLEGAEAREKQHASEMAQTRALIHKMGKKIEILEGKLPDQNRSPVAEQVCETRPDSGRGTDSRAETESDITTGLAKLVEILTSKSDQGSASRPIKQTPPSYHGGQMDANDWLKAYKLTSRANEWTNKQMANYLISVMKGSASDWFMAKFPDGCTDFEKFEEAFKKERIPVSYIADIRAKLYSVEPVQNETTTAYLDKLLNIGTQCSPQATEQEILGCFRKGVHPKVRNHILTIKTIEDLREALQNWEERKPQVEQPAQYPRPVAAVKRPPLSIAPPPAPDLKVPVAVPRPPITKPVPQNQVPSHDIRRMGKCHNCDEYGHHVAICPQPKDQARINESIRLLALKRNQTNQVNNQSTGNAALPGELVSKIPKTEAAYYANKTRKRQHASVNNDTQSPDSKKSKPWQSNCNAYQRDNGSIGLRDPMYKITKLLDASDNAPILPILINGIKVRALFDTGGAITLISESLANYLRLRLSPWSRATIKGVAGNVEPVGVSNKLRVVFMNTAVEMDVTVVAKLTPHVILGIDYLTSAEILIAPCLRRIEPAAGRFAEQYFKEGCESPYLLSQASSQEQSHLLEGEVVDLTETATQSQIHLNGFEISNPRNSAHTYQQNRPLTIPSCSREQCQYYPRPPVPQCTHEHMMDCRTPIMHDIDDRFPSYSISPILRRRQATTMCSESISVPSAPQTQGLEPSVRPKRQNQTQTDCTIPSGFADQSNFTFPKRTKVCATIEPPPQNTEVVQTKRADSAASAVEFLPSQRPSTEIINCTSLRARRIKPFSMSVVPIHVSTMKPGDYYITKHPMNRKGKLTVYEGLVRVSESQILEVLVANEGPEEVVLFPHEQLALLKDIEGDIIELNAHHDSKVIQLAHFFGEPTTNRGYVTPVKQTKTDNASYQVQQARPDTKIGQRTREEYLQKFHIGEELTLKQREQIGNLLVKYRDRFVFEGDSLGIVKGVTHVVDTGDAKPVNRQPYRVSLKERLAIEQQVNEMLDKGIITPIISEWGHPVVIVSKRDLTLRFCVDYRDTNAVTKPDNYPIPRLDDCLDLLGNSDIFSTLDACSAYWQIPMDPDSIEKTTFNCFLGSYAFLYMPFGLKNGPATCSRVMNRVFHGENRRTCIVYLDDCVVFAKGFDEHLTRLERIFEKLSEHNLKLKPSKCYFAQKSVSFLGHRVSAEGIIPDPERTTTLRNYPVPKDETTLRSFLGFTSFYRRHIKNYAKIARPLYHLLSKDVSFDWNADCQRAFEELKERVLNPPILAHYDPHALFVLRVDASTIGIGGHLTMGRPDQPLREARLFACCSRTLSVSEKNYGISQLECLAILFSIEKFHVYLHGTKFIVVTDHHALCYLQRLKKPNGRLFRWSNLVQGYDFEIRYTSGKSHDDADCLSRNPLQAQWEDLDKDYWEERMNQPGVFCLQPRTPPKTKVSKQFKPKTQNSDKKKRFRSSRPGKLNKFSVIANHQRQTRLTKVAKVSRPENKMSKSLPKCIEEIEVISNQLQQIPDKAKNEKTRLTAYSRGHGGPDSKDQECCQSQEEQNKRAKTEAVMSAFQKLLDDSDQSDEESYHIEEMILRNSQELETQEANMSATVTKSNQIEPNQVDSAVISGNIVPNNSRDHYSSTTDCDLSDSEEADMESETIDELIQNEIKEDLIFGPIYQSLENNTATEEDSAVYFIINNKLFRQHFIAGKVTNLICVPQKLIKRVLHECHDHDLSGHFGRDKTYEKVRQTFYWQTLRQDVDDYVKTCKACQFSKGTNRKPMGVPESLPVIKHPFEQLAMDCMGPITPKTVRNNEYILTIVCRATKYLFAEAVPNIEAATLVPIIANHFLCFGIPSTVLTDRGTNFTGRVMAQLFKDYGVKHLTTTSFHPETNGQCENANKTIGTALRTRTKKDDWDHALKLIVYAYNAAKNSTTGQEPYYLTFGTQPRMIYHNELATPPHWTEVQNREDLLAQVIIAREAAADKNQERQRRNRLNRMKGMSGIDLDIGQKVLLKNSQITKGSKLLAKYSGPYIIIYRPSHNVYHIATTEGKYKVAVVNAARLKPFFPRRTDDEQDESDNEASAESESSDDETDQEQELEQSTRTETPEATAEVESSSAEEQDDPIDGISRRQRRRPKHLDDYMCYALDADRENQSKEH